MLVKEELEHLLELQRIDDQLRELENSKVYLPDMISNIENDLQKWKQKHEEAIAQFDALSRERKHLELEIEVAGAALRKSQELMKSIKTNKEYDALSVQIATSKEKIGTMEEKLLEVMEEIDKAKEQAEEFKTRHGDLNKSNKGVLVDLRKEVDLIEDKMRSKESEREKIKVEVNPKTLSHYERVRRGKSGIAVVTVRKRSCGGCFKQLPPQMVQEIKKGDRLLTCDSCGRILLWAGDDSL